MEICIFVQINQSIGHEKMLCPQCKIAAMYVKNEAGERRLVYVTSEGEVIPKKKMSRLKDLI